MCIINLPSYRLHLTRFDPLYLLQHINFYRNSTRPNYFTICRYLSLLLILLLFLLLSPLLFYFIYLFHLIIIYLYIYLLIHRPIRPEGRPFGRFFSPGMLRVEGVG